MVRGARHTDAVIAVILVAALTIAWAWLGRRSLLYLLPAYIVAVGIDFPGSATVIAYPDLGFGFLEDRLVKVGDVLLLATAALVASVRREVKKPLPAMLVALTALVLIVHWYNPRYPDESVWFYAQIPARFGLLLALFRADRPLEQVDELRRTILAALGLFAVPVALLAVGYVVPAVDTFASTVGMRAGDGRVAFVGLGNNKIGLCLVMLAAASVITWERRPDSFRLPPLAVVTVAALLAGVAQLRFATTILFALVVLVALRRGPAHATVGLFGAAATVAAIGTGVLGDMGARSLSVVSGGFSFSTDSSFQSRRTLWGAAVDLWRDSPWIGRLGSWEWERVVPAGVLQSPIETHSEYLWWLASFGVLGAVLLLATLWPIFRSIRLGLVPAAAAVGVVVALALNAAVYFPAAAATLVFLSAVARAALDDRASGVGPSGAAEPDRLAEDGAVVFRTGTHGRR